MNQIKCNVIKRPYLATYAQEHASNHLPVTLLAESDSAANLKALELALSNGWTLLSVQAAPQHPAP